MQPAADDVAPSPVAVPHMQVTMQVTMCTPTCGPYDERSKCRPPMYMSGSPQWWPVVLTVAGSLGRHGIGPCACPVVAPSTIKRIPHVLCLKPPLPNLSAAEHSASGSPCTSPGLQVHVTRHIVVPPSHPPTPPTHKHRTRHSRS